MRIFLIGFMGCGKSTFGRKLAAKMSYDFIDLDHLFESTAGTSIREYFNANGEEAFRQEESRILKSHDYPTNCVVATGGGAPCYFDNMDWINNNGVSVYIQMSPAALAQRLEKGKAKRPLLKDLNNAEIVDFIEHKLAERASYYEQAAITTDGMNLNIEELIAQVIYR
ncbi:shikimate kinase [Pedobacter psychroterrae]|uniref:Shikimate kinase n=1 Tax=Pedobacter psychroterrae TaxID=2530453 RepID=A0A4R0NTW7_9SPHI|nr:shikimate kinase [Pedobacter psychroterrae]TCD02474.1 shikimate kinase [Pedobacter psychroterrae]